MYIYNDDCLRVFKCIPDNSIDMVLTDCPYKIGGGGCTTIKGGIFDKRINDHVGAGKMFSHNEIQFSEWMPEVYRVVKPGTHTYIMVNARNLSALQVAAERAGFKFVNLLVWRKNNVTPNRYYMSQVEFILMLRKGPARTINHPGTSNVIDVPNIIGTKRHPTEKPVALMRVLIENSTAPGDTVFDPFMGCGSTGVACVVTGREFIGIEIDKNYFDIASKRLPSALTRPLISV